MASPLTITLIHSFKTHKPTRRRPSKAQSRTTKFVFFPSFTHWFSPRRKTGFFEQAQSHHLPSSSAAGAHVWLKELSLAGRSNIPNASSVCCCPVKPVFKIFGFVCFTLSDLMMQFWIVVSEHQHLGDEFVSLFNTWCSEISLSKHWDMQNLRKQTPPWESHDIHAALGDVKSSPAAPKGWFNSCCRLLPG